MKTAILVIIIISCLILNQAKGDSENKATETRLSANEISTIESWAKTENPNFIEVLLPEYRQSRGLESVTHVPKPCIKHATKWAGKILLSKWLPDDLEQRWIGYKNITLMEKKNKEGFVFYSITGDYLVADYQIEEFTFHVQDTGGTLSVRIDFKEHCNLQANPTNQIYDLIEKFFAVSRSKMTTLKAEISTADNQLVFGVMKNIAMISPKQEMSKNGFIINKLRWDDLICVCLGQNFIFVYFYEKEEGKVNPQAKPGLPDRF
ncbi:MAG: hypothetical protein WC381_11590 [Kiritimatiellia bacterium]|jgi:hypothetical protein